MDALGYRKQIWAILKEFRDSKVMTLEEVTTRIIAVPVPEKGKKTDNSKFVVHSTYFPHDDKKKVL